MSQVQSKDIATIDSRRTAAETPNASVDYSSGDRQLCARYARSASARESSSGSASTRAGRPARELLVRSDRSPSAYLFDYRSRPNRARPTAWDWRAASHLKRPRRGLLNGLVRQTRWRASTPTIRDVAGRAGVSVGTVSNCFSGQRTVLPATAGRSKGWRIRYCVSSATTD
jgi:Bacterial regulatory proteins, lacI family